MRDRAGYLAGDDARRAGQLLALLEDPTVDAILCARSRWSSASCHGSTRARAPHREAAALQRRHHAPPGRSARADLAPSTRRCSAPARRGQGRTEAVRAALEGGRGRSLLRPRRRPRGKPLIGGSLQLRRDGLGTPFEVGADGAILLLKDIAEKPCAIDQMLQRLAAAEASRRWPASSIRLLSTLDSGADRPDRGGRARGDPRPLRVPLIFGLPSATIDEPAWPISASRRSTASGGGAGVEDGVEDGAHRRAARQGGPRAQSDGASRRPAPSCSRACGRDGGTYQGVRRPRGPYDERLPMAPDTIDLTSLAKVMATTTAVLLLVSKGALDLERPGAQGPLRPSASARRSRDAPPPAHALCGLRALAPASTSRSSSASARRASATIRTPTGVSLGSQSVLSLRPRARPGTAAVYGDLDFITLGHRRAAARHPRALLRGARIRPLGLGSTGYVPMAGRRGVPRRTHPRFAATRTAVAGTHPLG